VKWFFCQLFSISGSSDMSSEVGSMALPMGLISCKQESNGIGTSIFYGLYAYLSYKTDRKSTIFAIGSFSVFHLTF